MTVVLFTIHTGHGSDDEFLQNVYEEVFIVEFKICIIVRFSYTLNSLKILSTKHRR